MNIERIEIEHNKKVTVIISVVNFIAIIALCGCISLFWINKNEITASDHSELLIAAAALLSLCVLWLIVLLVNQICKLKRKIIFTADENGIIDHSRYIALAPIAWNEIKSIEYKEFLSDDASDFRHLKINLKDSKSYVKKLNFLQKFSFYLGMKHIEIHLFCGKTKVKEIAEKLKNNLGAFNRVANI